MYFKSMMVKRNLQLEEEAMKLMISKAAEENLDLKEQSKIKIILFFIRKSYFSLFKHILFVLK